MTHCASRGRGTSTKTSKAPFRPLDTRFGSQIRYPYRCNNHGHDYCLSRAYGCVIGAILGTLMYNTSSWGWGLTIAQLLALSGLIPFTNMIPSFWSLEEITTAGHVTPSFSEIYQKIFDTLTLKAVWYPMIFIYTYYILQVPNGAWTNFLVEGACWYLSPLSSLFTATS
jgi:hypothetical protein